MPFAPQARSPAARKRAATRSRNSGSRSFARTSEDISVTARAPWAMTSSSAASTRASPMAKITCSTGSGRSASDGKQGRPQTVAYPGLTANSGPWKPPFSRFSTVLRPTVPLRSVAPSTAIERGRSSESSR